MAAHVTEALLPTAWGRRPIAGRLLLLAPITVLYGLLMLVPLAFIVKTSFEGGGFSHYRDVLETPVLWRVVENTLVISSLTTVIAVALAYLYAAALWRSGPILRTVLLGLVLLPFWTGVLVKNFAWAALLQDNGVIIDLLRGLGCDQPISLLHNRFAVIVGMVHYVLPYAVFPIYSTMLAIDLRLVRAARSLGASQARAIWKVVVPLTLPGVLAAALLVFIVSTGFFITPILLGAPSDMMIANLVDFYTNQIVDFSGAAALAVLIAATVSVLAIAYQRVPKEGQYGEL